MLYPDLEFTWSLFKTLDQSREYDGFSGIPKSISTPWQVNGLFELFQINDVNERKILLNRIQILDRAFISYVIKKMEQKKKADKNDS